MTDTAERIGSAVGTAQRQMRRGLELVRQLPRRARHPGHADRQQEIRTALLEHSCRRSKKLPTRDLAATALG